MKMYLLLNLEVKYSQVHLYFALLSQGNVHQGLLNDFHFGPHMYNLSPFYMKFKSQVKLMSSVRKSNPLAYLNDSRVFECSDALVYSTTVKRHSTKV
jgi:hypothetical protein